MSVEASSKKVEVTLRTKINRETRKPDSVEYSHLHVGDVIHGFVRRVELYGLFITIDDSRLVCYVVLHRFILGLIVRNRSIFSCCT
jgi:rRNA biogenesis protein RRP5